MGFKYFLPVKDELNGIFYGRNKNKLTFYTEALSIVTSGLVLNLDAGNSSSYPGSGTTWTDLSSNSNDGTLVNGPTYSSTNGGSIVFDGSNDYVNISNDLRSDVGEFLAESSNTFSVSVWFFPDTTDTNRNAIFTKALGFGSAGNVYLEYNGTNLSSVIRGTATNNYYTSLTSSWHELAITWDGTTLKSYLDGSFLSNLNVGTAVAQTVQPRLGASGNGGETFLGRISVAKVYDRALSASEVTQNYNALKDRFALSIVTSGLVLNLDAGDSSSYPGSGTTWTDLSGNNNDFTISGATYSSADGGSFTFGDNEGDYVLRSATDVIGGLTDLTVEMWIRIETLQTQITFVSYNTSSTDNAFMVFKVSANAIRAYLGSSYVNTTFSDSNWNTGSYINFVIARSGTNIKYYIDGTFITETNSYFSGSIATGGTLVFGQEQDSPGGGFNTSQDFPGDYAKIAIYNRQLSASEVTQNFDALKARYGL